MIRNDHEFRSCGTDKDLIAVCRGTTPISEDLVNWAHVVFCMEQRHVDEVRRHRTVETLGKVINLDILDNYFHMEHTLIKVLNYKVTPYLDKTLEEIV